MCVIPFIGITVKIESDDKDCDDGNGILTNEEAVHDQELEGKYDIYVPDQELGGKCDREVPAQELEGKCEVALHDQELGGKCDLAVPHQELEGKGDIAVPDQELEGTCDMTWTKMRRRMFQILEGDSIRRMNFLKIKS